MMVLQNEKTKEIKRIYTGKEIIIAMGKKYQNLHDLYKEHYNEYFELFGDEEDPITVFPQQSPACLRAFPSQAGRA